MSELSDSKTSQTITPATRTGAAQNSIRRRPVRDFLGKGVDWLYWNTQFYRVAALPRLQFIHSFYLRYRQRKKFGIDTPILVYQMGKVGSSSLTHSLRKLDLGVPVHYMSFLNRLDEFEALSKQREPDNRRVFEMLATARAIRREMERHPHKRWNLISLVRAPIPRLVSSFFEDIHVNFPNFPERFAEGTVTAQELAEYFVAHYRDRTPLYWFDLQVKQVFDLDVFATPFDCVRGYQIYDHERARLLILRLEDLNRVVTEAMREFLNLSDFTLIQRNIGQAKPTGALYREFVEILRLPDSFVAEWHTSRYAQHFYTPQELEASIARWV